MSDETIQWSDKEIREMCQQAIAELRGFASHLIATGRGITGKQLTMVLQLAQAGLKNIQLPDIQGLQSDTLTNDDVAKMIEDAHAYGTIVNGVKHCRITTDALTLVLRELIAARAEVSRLEKDLHWYKTYRPHLPPENAYPRHGGGNSEGI